MKAVDTIHQFRGYHADGGVCRITIYTAAGKPPLVVCTELVENTNTSVTNMAELLAAEVMERYLTADDLGAGDPPFVWLERYEEPADRRFTRTKAVMRRYGDYDRVTFKHYRRERTFRNARPPTFRYTIGCPEWHPMKIEEAEALIRSYEADDAQATG
jgi:hypothetical protein